MILRRLGSVLCLSLICGMSARSVLSAQARAPTGSRAGALERFAAWTGRWDGGGWSVDRTGRRKEFTLVETVTPKADGTVRFTIRVSQDTWHEIGEASGDGSSWMKFMEIDLRRTP